MRDFRGRSNRGRGERQIPKLAPVGVHAMEPAQREIHTSF